MARAGSADAFWTAILADGRTVQLAAMVAEPSAFLPWASSKSLLDSFNRAKGCEGEKQDLNKATNEQRAALQLEHLCGLLHTANLKYGHLFTDEVSLSEMLGKRGRCLSAFSDITVCLSAAAWTV